MDVFPDPLSDWSISDKHGYILEDPLVSIFCKISINEYSMAIKKYLKIDDENIHVICFA